MLLQQQNTIFCLLVDEKKKLCKQLFPVVFHNVYCKKHLFPIVFSAITMLQQHHPIGKYTVLRKIIVKATAFVTNRQSKHIKAAGKCIVFIVLVLFPIDN